jgi:hypothetical protein
MTIVDMCETIAKAKILCKSDGTHPTAVEIFNYSPTGELFMIWIWYDDAKLALSNDH